MAINYPGPFEVRLNYVTNELPAAIAAHTLRLSCNMSITADPGDPFTDWIPYERGGSAVANLATKVDALVTLLRPFYVAAVDFTGAELWEYTPGSFDAIYRSSYSIGLPGTGAGTTSIAGQAIMSFRTTLGGIMKVDLRGTNLGPGITQTYPFGAGVVANLAAALIATTNVWWGRDNSYPLIPLRFMPGQNESAWRIANRP